MTPSKSAVPFWLAVEPSVNTKRLTCDGSFSFSSATRSAVGRVAFDEAVEKAVIIASWMRGEEETRAHAAEELDRRRVDDELVDRQCQDHDADVARQLDDDLEAEIGGDREQQCRDADRGEADDDGDEPHGDVVEAFDRLLEAPRGLGAGERETDAEEQGEEHPGQEVAVDRRLEGIRRHDLGHQVHPRLRRLRLGEHRRALGGARHHSRPGLVGEPLAGLEYIHQDQSEEDGDRRHHHRVGERLQADPPEALQIAEAGDPEHQRREDERHDQHEEQAEEDLPHRLRHVGEEPDQPRIAGEVAMRHRPATMPIAKPISIRVCNGKRRRSARGGISGSVMDDEEYQPSGGGCSAPARSGGSATTGSWSLSRSESDSSN